MADNNMNEELNINSDISENIPLWKKNKKEYIQEYVKEKYHRVPVNFTVEDYEFYKAKADEFGYNGMSGLIKAVLEEKFK